MVCWPQAQVRCKRLLLDDDPIAVFCCTWTFAYARSLMLLPFDASEHSSLNSIPYDALFSLNFDCVGEAAVPCSRSLQSYPIATILASAWTNTEARRATR